MGLIRKQLSTGVGFDVESYLIRAYQHSWCPYTHVDIVMPDGQLLGARADGGVLIRAADYQPFAATLVVDIAVADEIEAAYYAFARAQIGKPYDFTAIAHMALIDVDPAKPTQERDWRENDSWFCSELDLACMEASRALPYSLGAPVKVLTPADDLLICSALVDIWGAPFPVVAAE